MDCLYEDRREAVATRRSSLTVIDARQNDCECSFKTLNLRRMETKPRWRQKPPTMRRLFDKPFSSSSNVVATPVFQLYSVLIVCSITFLMLSRSATSDFIDKVECEKDKMVVYINEAKVQDDYPAIGVDRYSVYVHQFKETCHDQGIVSQSNSLKSKRFVVPLNAGCGINSQADNTMGIHKEWLVYQATVRLEAMKPRSPDGRILEQRVKCVYSTSHQATASSNRLLVKGADNANAIATSRQSSSSSPILGAGTVEGSAPPIENFIELCFASTDPKFSALQEATIGDAVRIVLRMSHNVAYSAMKPEFCIISNKPYANRNDPDFRELIVVNGGCSVQSTPPLIPKMVYRASLVVGEPEMYYSKFTMFKMGDYNELHAMCNVKLCISSSEKACDTTQPRGCFESVRRRRKRSPDRWNSFINETLPTLSPMAAALQRHRAANNNRNQHQSSAARNSPLALTMPTIASSAAGTPVTIKIPLLINNNNNNGKQQYALTSSTSTPTFFTSSTDVADTTSLSYTTTAASSKMPFNPDLLTVSGRLHVNRQNADSAAISGSQLCFNSLTFSILAAVLAWLFLLSFCCVVLLALLLRRQKRKQLKKSTNSSSDSRGSSRSSDTPTSSIESSSCNVISRRVEDFQNNNSNVKTSEHHHHYQEYADPVQRLPTNPQSTFKTGTLMYSIPQHHTTRLNQHHQYHGAYCSTGEGAKKKETDDLTMMLKMHYAAPHQQQQQQSAVSSLLRHHKSFSAVTNDRAIGSPLATTITATRHRQAHHRRQRHHTLKPTTAASSCTSSASSTSSSLPLSPSPMLLKAGKMISNDDCSTYDVVGPQKLDY